MNTDPTWLTDPDPAEGLRRFRRFRSGTLVHDGVPTPCKYIIDGRDGRVVLPVSVVVADAAEHVLWLPDERFGAMQALLLAEPLDDELDEARDRYLAYHGRAEEVRWIRCVVDSAREGGEVFDGDDLTRPNAARPVEPKLCKLLNSDRDKLRTITSKLAGVLPETALAVGVDEDGIDVRVTLGVVRVEFPRRARDADEAEATVRGLLTEIGGA
ncbi:MAG: hypothetical protein AAF297_05660 [Planctomycetota bacterium]